MGSTLFGFNCTDKSKNNSTNKIRIYLNDIKTKVSLNCQENNLWKEIESKDYNAIELFTWGKNDNTKFYSKNPVSFFVSPGFLLILAVNGVTRSKKLNKFFRSAFGNSILESVVYDVGSLTKTYLMNKKVILNLTQSPSKSNRSPKTLQESALGSQKSKKKNLLTIENFISFLDKEFPEDEGKIAFLFCLLNNSSWKKATKEFIEKFLQKQQSERNNDLPIPILFAFVKLRFNVPNAFYELLWKLIPELQRLNFCSHNK